ncbi:hypothetical protein SCLARK_001598 [Spiroplasma clarkii]|uniref:Uncharacterized protein n=1 Tax=Spiroplasma clarkii TaxID=2139 RepID=A0A1Y0L2U8_9MOLU|nr:hypothetical protein [Spiroplasma clarkii]ARU92090.1 hypothetical protein SCLARK_001598 [Spiroplasma clarkii]ATX71422.1 hypothetical protein SCLAR_v1c11220 [Spiroplasma clarkii]
MAKLLSDNSVEFSAADILQAWENAPILINKEPELVRMCYICKFHMLQEKFNHQEIGELGWVIDLINAKKPELISSNFVAIHPYCLEYKAKSDNSKVLKKIKSQIWKFDEEAFKEQ